MQGRRAALSRSQLVRDRERNPSPIGQPGGQRRFALCLGRCAGAQITCSFAAVGTALRAATCRSGSRTRGYAPARMTRRRAARHRNRRSAPTGPDRADSSPRADADRPGEPTAGGEKGPFVDDPHGVLVGREPGPRASDVLVDGAGEQDRPWMDRVAGPGLEPDDGRQHVGYGCALVHSRQSAAEPPNLLTLGRV